jgi:hypothetical protein
MKGRDGGGCYSKRNPDKGHRDSIQEYSNEEAEGDYGTREEDAQGWTGMEDDIRRADCERKDEPASNLVEGCVDEF